MKKYITDVFNDLSESAEKSFCGYTVRENMDELARERVYQNVMSSINANENRCSELSHRPRMKKIAIAAAACMIIASMGAVGVGASRLYKGFAEYNPSYTEAQKQEIEKASYPVGQTTSGEGVSITATEAMYDGEKLFLMIDTVIDPDKISVADGAVFGSRIELHMTGDPNDTQGFSAQYHKVLERKGNTCTQLVVFDAVDLAKGAKAALSARGLSVLREEGDSVIAVDMDAKIGNGFVFEYKKGDFASSFSSDSGIRHLGRDAKVMGGYIAPWYAQFDLMINSEDEKLVQSIFDSKNYPEFKVIMRDGTVHEGIAIDQSGSGSGNDDASFSAIFNFRCSFNEYVETSEIDHIEINGCRVSLNNA